MTIAHSPFRSIVDRPRALARTCDEQLASGGGQRICIDEITGLNRYGCYALPQRDVLAFGSCTASTISADGFAAAQQFWRRIYSADEAKNSSVYEHEAQRIRHDIARLLELPAGTQVILTASGTDAHLIASQLWAATDEGRPAEMIVVGEEETGRGVPAALRGCHFDTLTPGEVRARRDEKIDGAVTMPVNPVAIRLADGSPRDVSEINEQVHRLISEAIVHGNRGNRGNRVLLVTTDVSKTGLRAPSRPYVETLCRDTQAKAGDLSVLVDACQMRMNTAALRQYLEDGCMVAVTGSKFIAGPTFCGAILVPANISEKYSSLQSLPAGLRDYTMRSHWPASQQLREQFAQTGNWGLLLRWEAALSELRAFARLPRGAARKVTREFARAVMTRLAEDKRLEYLSSSQSCEQRRQPGGDQWDHLPSIFTFALRGADGRRLGETELRQVYRALREGAIDGQICELGQPVRVGVADSEELWGLRLSLSASLIVDAASGETRQAAMTAGAMTALDLAVTSACDL